MDVLPSYRMRRDRGSSRCHIKSMGELIERALCLYDAGLNPTEAAHDMFGVLH